ncbi:MAG: bifunctional adenosylcobinamide kinase/adenosylcobinamide-phosphate guanylyltransferase [Candidatus Omnitrophota bacterium]
MGKIIFILGGARSGKSSFALELAKKHKKVAFVATCRGLDKEMRQRIKKHQQSRPKSWATFEQGRDITVALGQIKNNFDCIVIDCLTLWVSNLLLGGNKEEKITQQVIKMLTALKQGKSKVILVSNEVGLGIVPANKLARQFRDIAGRVNQLVAKEADEVFFTVSGIPMKIKKG